MSEKDEKEQPKATAINRRQFITGTATAAGAVALTSVLEACGGSSSTPTAATTDAQTLSSTAWKFGVMADTQWTVVDDGYNPNTAAVGIAAQIQQQFINQGVKFVVHVGDLCDIDILSSSSANDGNPAIASSASPQAGEQDRALYTQALYNAGIGYFPLRGNHDEDAPGAVIFQQIYPQTQNGQHQSPATLLASFASSDGPTKADAANNPVPASSGSNFTVGSNFSSPDPWSDGGLKGLSYSFDFNGARFILLDQFAPTTGQIGGVTVTSSGSDAIGTLMSGTIGGDPNSSVAGLANSSAQQPWISQQLSGRSGSHSFVFAHKGLLTCNHADILFTPSSGANAKPSYNTTAQNAFFTSLYNNGVRLYINGHDHMYDRSIVTSPDGKSTVMQITCASNSSKFYPPQGSGSNYTPNYSSDVIPLSTPSNPTSVDIYYNNPTRRQVVSQELFTVGYYIVTINGSLVNVDYYSANLPTYQDPSDVAENLCSSAQGLNFVKRESFGYGLNGKQFIVAKGGSYTVVQDSSSGGTTAKILSGTNNCATTDACYLPYVKVVTTGWMSASSGSASDIVTLWGINPFEGASNPDTYVLSMGTGSSPKGNVICALDSNGNWNNAVNQNSGGTKNYVSGPWNASYGLGTYGVDPTTNTVWAVLNYDGMFALAPGS